MKSFFDYVVISEVLEHLDNEIERLLKAIGFDINKIIIGNINAFRDWSHITDMIKEYCLLAEEGNYGDVYNLGSQRTNSVLSYILLSLEAAGYSIDKIETANNREKIENPTEMDNSDLFGLRFQEAVQQFKIGRKRKAYNALNPKRRSIFDVKINCEIASQKTKIDKMMIEDGLQFNLSDKGIIVYTNKGKVLIEFDQKKFRPAEISLLLSNTGKIQNLGFKITHTLRDIIIDQLNYFTMINQL